MKYNPYLLKNSFQGLNSSQLGNELNNYNKSCKIFNNSLQSNNY